MGRAGINGWPKLGAAAAESVCGNSFRLDLVASISIGWSPSTCRPTRVAQQVSPSRCRPAGVAQQMWLSKCGLAGVAQEVWRVGSVRRFKRKLTTFALAPHKQASWKYSAIVPSLLRMHTCQFGINACSARFNLTRSCSSRSSMQQKQMA